MGMLFKPVRRHSLIEAHVKVIQRAQRAKVSKREWAEDLAALPLFHVKHTAMSIAATGEMVRRHRSREGRATYDGDIEPHGNEIGTYFRPKSSAKPRQFRLVHPSSYYNAAAKLIQQQWATKKGTASVCDSPTSVAAHLYATYPRTSRSRYIALSAAAIFIEAHWRGRQVRRRLFDAQKLTPGAFRIHTEEHMRNTRSPMLLMEDSYYSKNELVLKPGDDVYGLRWCRGTVRSVQPNNMYAVTFKETAAEEVIAQRNLRQAMDRGADSPPSTVATLRVSPGELPVFTSKPMSTPSKTTISTPNHRSAPRAPVDSGSVAVHRKAPRLLAELPAHKVEQITALSARQYVAETAFVLADEAGEGWAMANVLRIRLVEVMQPGESASLARLLDEKLGGLNASRQVGIQH